MNAVTRNIGRSVRTRDWRNVSSPLGRASARTRASPPSNCVFTLGWTEDRSILIGRKAAAGRVPAAAPGVVQSKPDLLIASSPQPVRAAKNATTEISIVMPYVADPVGVDLAQSLACPGGT